MKQEAADWIRTRFSLLSGLIIVIEGVVILVFVYLYAPVGQLVRSLSGIFGTLLTLMVAIRVAVWFFREFRGLHNESDERKGGQVEMEDSPSRPIEDALQTTDDRFDAEVSKITDWMRIDEHGEITLLPGDDTSDDPKYLLYVVAARVAQELGRRDSPGVSAKELEKQVSTVFPVGPFLGKATPFLIYNLHGEEVESWSDVPHHSRNQVEVEIDINQIEGAVNWIRTGSRNVPKSLRN
jgi:hypothetical protein